MGGKWRNNTGGPVPDKIAFQTAYKFVLAVENYSAPGYLTEKFAQAAQSNAIPIYWGDPTITQYINPKAFINCHDFESPQALVAKVREIDNDDAAYRAMLSEPWFINGEEPPEWRDATFTNFLCNIFDQPHESAYRRNRSRWGIKTEVRLNKMANQPFRQSLFLLKRKLRQIRRK
ncbi:MAG: Alpha-(1,3)-fucosyltransferase FucT [Opitutia bacterium UBA7350]|nr:MAG: Alpha-(1,3)-fucosyltransferase FucT [Opitutae bacterium UBA7350]